MFKLISHEEQELFDRGTWHLFHMPRKCANPFPRYLIPSTGERCPVGVLIDTPTKRDEYLLSDLIGGVESLQRAGLLELTSQRVTDILMTLQTAHDMIGSWSGWGFYGYDRLRLMAEDMKLDTDIINVCLKEKRTLG